MGHVDIEMDWSNEPATYALEAHYPEAASYSGQGDGVKVDPLPGGENDCTYLNVHVHPTGNLTYLTGNHGCDELESA